MIRLAFILKTVTSVVNGAPSTVVDTHIHPLGEDMKTFLIEYLQNNGISSEHIRVYTEGGNTLVGPINDYENEVTTSIHITVFEYSELPYYSKFLNQAELLKTREKLVELGFEFKG